MDYARSENLGARYEGRLGRFPTPRWTPDSEGLWWREDGPAGESSYVHVDGTSGVRTHATEIEGVGAGHLRRELEPRAKRAPSRAGGESTEIHFINDFDRPLRIFWMNHQGEAIAYGRLAAGAEKTQSTFVGHVWVLDFVKDDVAGIFVAEEWKHVARATEGSRQFAMQEPEELQGPSGPRYFVRDSNLWMSEGTTERQLSTSATAKDIYRLPVHVSPSGRHGLAFQEQVVKARRIPLLDSSPGARLQPVLEWIDYPKPGDAVPQRRPRLFDLHTGEQIPVDDGAFADSYSLRFMRWSPDGKRAYCLYNERGHQRLVLFAIEAATGQVRAIVDERSSTFVDYSQKTSLHWLDRDGDLLWASERDGFNHLFRIDAITGEVQNQVTRGDWVMRRVEHVDEAAQVVWFCAMGIHPGQDPYHEHLAKVNFDGTQLQVLTQGDGDHRWSFNPQRSLFIDRWSRVDQVQVTELRRADGTLVGELGRDDASELLAQGYRPPRRMVAKGRDGKTDIFGQIIFPSNFEVGRKYAVIDSIYSGPHDFHVGKRWGLQIPLRRMAELGFIVVQIDGMGTNWRSKAFHDICWRNLKDGGLPDHIAWLRAAAVEHPEMDLGRVGIYGGSAGGQNALAALLHHGDFYSAAAADCGCHDNRMDKIWWNEAWMGRMGEHYAQSSNVSHAAKLQGDLLLTVGELDRNVDPASTLQVVDALIEADKIFEFVIVPGAGHGVGEAPYLFRRRQDFFVRSLYGLEPRRP